MNKVPTYRTVHDGRRKASMSLHDTVKDIEASDKDKEQAVDCFLIDINGKVYHLTRDTETLELAVKVTRCRIRPEFENPGWAYIRGLTRPLPNFVKEERGFLARFWDKITGKTM